MIKLFFILLLIVFIININNINSKLPTKELCEVSVFDYKTAFHDIKFSLAEKGTTVPHPFSGKLYKDGPVCGNIGGGAPSCCTEETLDHIVMMMKYRDSLIFFVNYFIELLINDINYFIEQIKFYLTALNDNSGKLPGQEVSNYFVEQQKMIDTGLQTIATIFARGKPMNQFLNDLMDDIRPFIGAVNTADATYFSGMLCSVCIPDMYRFIDTSQNMMYVNVETCNAYAEPIIDLIDEIFKFINTEHGKSSLKNAVIYTCNSLPASIKKEIGGTCSGSLGSYIDLGLSMFPSSKAKQLLCDYGEGSVFLSKKTDEEVNMDCKELLCDTYMKGAFFNYLPTLNKIYDNYIEECKTNPSACGDNFENKIEFAEVYNELITGSKSVLNLVYNKNDNLESYSTVDVGCQSTASDYGCTGKYKSGTIETYQVGGGGMGVIGIILIIASVLLIAGSGFVIYKRKFSDFTIGEGTSLPYLDFGSNNNNNNNSAGPIVQT